MSEFEAAFFKHKKLNRQRLLSYGFSKTNHGYSYSADIVGGQFQMIVFVSGAGEIHTKVLDTESTEEYVLHRASGASGAFVGAVKDAYENVLRDISQRCFEPDVFKSEQATQLIQYVRNTYGDELEFLWQRFPDNAVWRRKDTGKWYGALLTVPRNKLGFDSNERVEILDLRIRPEELEGLIDHERYFPGYHMNKKHWYTILLDDSVSLSEIQARIDVSYQLEKK